MFRDSYITLKYVRPDVRWYLNHTFEVPPGKCGFIWEMGWEGKSKGEIETKIEKWRAKGSRTTEEKQRKEREDPVALVK
jgi:hypothetical protein